MNLVVRPGGLTENVIAHMTPQNAGNDLKDLRVKLEETMLGSCVKSLIKERLYG